MTTDFVSVAANWTVEQTLKHIHDVGRSRETVYAVCVLDPETNRLVKVITLWRLVVADPKTNVLDAARPYKPITVSPLTDREEVARLLSKYDLLAVPVVAEDDHVLGIVTVDDVIDAIIAEGTEDVQKFGGVEALERALSQDQLRDHDPQARRLAVCAVPVGDADDQRHAGTTRSKSKRRLS